MGLSVHAVKHVDVVLLKMPTNVGILTSCRHQQDKSYVQLSCPQKCF